MARAGADRKGILEALRQPIQLGSQRVVLTTSIGIAHSGVSAQGLTHHRVTAECTPESLLRDADSALHRAKALGGDRAVPFDAGMHQQALGHGLGKRVLAEGVETFEQLESLRALGWDEVSGFYLARPVPPADLIEAIEQGVRTLRER